MDGLCIIYGAGEYFGNEFALPGRDDFVIAADGGFDIVSGHGIRPDLVVGDFDSLGKRPEGDNVLCFPVLKDETDMMIAVKEGFSRGFGNSGCTAVPAAGWTIRSEISGCCFISLTAAERE